MAVPRFLVDNDGQDDHDFAHVTQIIMLVAYVTMFVLCVLLILYLRYNRNEAFKGDTNAGRKLLLPAFEPLLWILGAASGTLTLFLCFALGMDLYKKDIPDLPNEFLYAGRQFLFVLVIVFMYQKSVSIPALRRTVVISLLLACYTLPVVWYHHEFGNPAHRTRQVTIQTLVRCLLILFYVYVFVFPPGRATNRTIREFCGFVLIYYIQHILSTCLVLAKNPDSGYYLAHAQRLWASLCPLVIWRVLKADTEYWRGMGKNAVALQGIYRQKHHMHERISSQGLHVLIEMHRKYIIDFAHLELKQRIGVGATSTVFHGILYSRIPVAIKVYTPTTFNEEVVASFSQEAALCGALHHPNIVRFFGMCVSPPTICLVSELCQGNLNDIIQANARRSRHPDRQQLLINIAYMLDAARAVAYIHSFSPPFLHRDIKPSNFLVDTDCNVKLTDFGESRSVFQPDTVESVNNKGSGFFSQSRRRRTSSTLSHDRTQPLIPPLELLSPRMRDVQMTVKGTVDYMAPELIEGKAGLASYGEAADVYSLAITMWDILNPGVEKFPQTQRNHLQTFAYVMDGNRPELNPFLHTGLRHLIECAWQQDPLRRPTAHCIVDILEAIQEEVSATFFLDVLDTLHPQQEESPAPNVTVPLSSTSNSMARGYVTGAHLVERMQILHYVNSSAEGIRMGNAWMDSGLLHHVKHGRGFEDNDSLFFFDEVNIRLSQPFADGGGSIASDAVRAYSSISASSELNPHDVTEQYSNRSTRTTDGAPAATCSCRKFGQRVEQYKLTRRDKFRRKFKPIAEENVLTAALLTEEDTPLQQEFDAIDERACSIVIMRT